MSSRELLTNPKELLHRQIHPNFVQGSRASGLPGLRLASPGFKPQADLELSVSQGRLISAEQAHARYTARGPKSGGVWSITVGECSTAGRQVFHDPIIDDDLVINDSAHAIIDFKGLEGKALSNAWKKLARFANDRGCQYAP